MPSPVVWVTSVTATGMTRGDVTVKTLTASDNLAPGKEFSFTDTGVPAGMTTYTLLCSNSIVAAFGNVKHDLAFLELLVR